MAQWIGTNRAFRQVADDVTDFAISDHSRRRFGVYRSTMSGCAVIRPDRSGRSAGRANLARRAADGTLPSSAISRPGRAVCWSMNCSAIFMRAVAADIRTAFVAEWGEGGPVIGLLDRIRCAAGDHPIPALLPRGPVDGKHAGHACGHNLFDARVRSAQPGVATGSKLPERLELRLEQPRRGRVGQGLYGTCGPVRR